jgi:hypothetical protein
MRLQIALQPEIGHDGRHEPPAPQIAPAVPELGDHRHELVAIDDLALLVDDDDAVRVAIERDADIGAQLLHLGDQLLRRGRADLVVDVEAVRLDADLEDFGAQFPQRRRRHLVGRAIGAIEHDAQAAEVDALGQGALGEFDVARLRRLVAMRPADVAAFDSLLEQSLSISSSISVLDLVGELVAVGAEQLDAVVVVRVVRGRDHHAQIGAQRARQHGDGGCRHRAEQVDVHAHGGEAGGERALDHVAGAARVLADDDAVALLAFDEVEARRHADLHRQLRRQLAAIGEPANAVGAEVLARHETALSIGRGSYRTPIPPQNPTATAVKGR